jgi:hypothetical protein
MQPARNGPCPCGSGKRYKHCHGALIFDGIEAPNFGKNSAPPDVFRRAAAEFAKIRERERLLGDVRLPNTVEFAGSRIVGVGGTIWAVDPKYPPINFMSELLVRSLGAHWFGSELEKGQGVAHPAITWYRATMDWQNQHVDAGGSSVPR